MNGGAEMAYSKIPTEERTYTEMPVRELYYEEQEAARLFLALEKQEREELLEFLRALTEGR